MPSSAVLLPLLRWRIFPALQWLLLIAIYLFLGVKSLFEFSIAGDVLAYHLPQALRLFGQTTFEPTTNILNVLKGYPQLTFFIQGALILMTGKFSAVNAINFIGLLLALLSIYALYGRTFSFRWFLTFLLSIPLVVLQLPIGYNDLFTAFAVLIAFTGLHAISTSERKGPSSIVIVAGFVLACLAKATAWPSIAGFLLVAAYVLWRDARAQKIPSSFAAGLFSALFFILIAFPVRNTLLYRNPTYPWQPPFISKFISFPGNRAQGVVQTPGFLIDTSPPVRLVYSVFELNRWQTGQPYKWSYDQYAPETSPHRRMGGWFYLSAALFLAAWLLGVFYYRVIDMPSSIALSLGLFIFACTSRSTELRFALFFPLGVFFLVVQALPRYTISFSTAIKLSLSACAIFVLLTLNIWKLDLRLPSEKAPLRAQQFWVEHADDAKTVFSIAEQPLTIFWSGPTFSQIKVKALSTPQDTGDQ